jgi:ribosomal protein RSM22 (predicted rRNA methylase)
MLPFSLESRIQSFLQGTSLKDWIKSSQKLTTTYRQNNKKTEALSSETLRIVYLCSRLPATYTVISYVFAQLQKKFDLSLIHSLLDCGAGPGSALLAAHSFFSLKQAVLLERDLGFIRLGKFLLEPTHTEVIWVCQDVTRAIPSSTKDLVIASYSLCEIAEEDQMRVVESLWDKTGQILVIIEPGTPKGFHCIRRAREKLIDIGAFLAAPCPHAQACPISKSDWCHFSVRLPRSSQHRQVKDATLNYEDEKFSYLVFSRTPVSHSLPRVVRHPVRRSGFVKLQLCANTGLIEKTVSRRDKAQYAIAKKLQWGDET